MTTGWAAARGAAAHVLVPALSDDVTVGGDDGHHLARVRRLRAGEEVTAADGAGHWRAYEVDHVEGATLGLRAVSGVHTEPVLVPRLAVAFALTRGADAVVRHLTELGVDRILGVRTERSVPRWTPQRTEAAVARWQRVVREAAGQCHRAHLPEVGAPGALTEVLGHPGLIVADHAGTAPEVMTEPEGGEWLVVVGPEGGLAPAERERLGDAPRLALGPHVLRAETAALAAAATLGCRRRPAGTAPGSTT